MSEGPRTRALAAACFNSARLPAAEVACDLSTDVRAPSSARAEGDPSAAVDAAIAALVARAGWWTTPRGRVAEAALAAALVRPGAEVLSNEVYVTGAWSIAREGGSVVDVAGSIVERPGSGWVEGLDLDRIGERLRGGRVAAIWLTTPRVLLGPRGGAIVDPAAIAALVELRDRLDPRAPIVVDATKIGEWSARAGIAGSPADRLRWLFGQVDWIALSGRKDAGGAPLGLLVAGPRARVDALDRAARILGPRPHRPAAPMAALAAGLRRLPAAGVERWRELDALGRALRGVGAPLLGWGGGALFIDAARALPRVPADESPAATLLALLYLGAGIRGLGTPVGAVGEAILRLSVREHGTWLLGHLAPLLDGARGFSSGLVAAGPPPAPFLEPLRPRDPEAWRTWPEGQVAPTSAGPAVLGHDPAGALRAALRRRLALPEGATIVPVHGPERRLAELWSRLARVDAEVRGAPALAALARAWPRPGGALGDLVIGPDPADVLAHDRRAGDLVAVDLGPPGRWPARLGADGAVDLWVLRALDGDEVGALVLRPGSPLVAALAESVLFSAGAPASGGIDDEVLLELADRLA